MSCRGGGSPATVPGGDAAARFPAVTRQSVREPALQAESRQKGGTKLPPEAPAPAPAAGSSATAAIHGEGVTASTTRATANRAAPAARVPLAPSFRRSTGRANAPLTVPVPTAPSRRPQPPGPSPRESFGRRCAGLHSVRVPARTRPAALFGAPVRSFWGEVRESLSGKYGSPPVAAPPADCRDATLGRPPPRAFRSVHRVVSHSALPGRPRHDGGKRPGTPGAPGTLGTLGTLGGNEREGRRAGCDLRFRGVWLDFR
jgi:hypothetical protein